MGMTSQNSPKKSKGISPKTGSKKTKQSDTKRVGKQSAKGVGGAGLGVSDGGKTPTPADKITLKAAEILPLLNGFTMSEVEGTLRLVGNYAYLYPIQLAPYNL